MHTSDGAMLVGLVRPTPDPNARWVVFFGGNGSRLDSNWGLLERAFRDEPVGLATFAYRGYDGSTGNPREKDLRADGVRIVRDLATKHSLQPDRLVLMGHSLGSGVATWVAAKLSYDGMPPDGLILVAPYTSIPAVARDHMPWCTPTCLIAERFNSKRMAPHVRAKALLLHGTDDDVIAIDHARRLVTRFDDARLVELPGRGHVDLFDDHRFIDEVRAFVAR